MLGQGLRLRTAKVAAAPTRFVVVGEEGALRFGIQESHCMRVTIAGFHDGHMVASGAELVGVPGRVQDRRELEIRGVVWTVTLFGELLQH